VDALRAQAGAAAPPAEPSPAEPPSAAKPAAPTPAPAPQPAAAPASGDGQTGELLASPVARKMAGEAGLDIRLIPGSGPGGRVVKRDVEAFLRRGPSEAAPQPAAVSGQDTEVPLTRLRQIIGRRMGESMQSAPHFYITVEVDMAATMALRAQLNTLVPEAEKISVNDFIIKAAALALREIPNLNATLQGDKLIRRGRVNIGIAVAVEGGLITPVVPDADSKPLAEIAVEARALVGRARSGKIKPADVEGGTFTLSNLGMFDVVDFTAIINPPEVAILAVSTVRQVPVVAGGALAVGTRMAATLSADHRATDGAEAARYLQAFRRLLEAPLRLLL
jgi:pyruvate dehydrogenase E2 component (dihydrolipoamide acetyltransferase)